ncbi:MAG: hypothetical protein HFF22_08650 [Oscillospiraceae bacterium]|jgi:hypothetical protein|nr:hypothetical protein [Oscillospiraceae bacterium]
MSLTTHPYHFFSDEAAFLALWRPTLERLAGDAVQSVLGVWDRTDLGWNRSAPMLVCLSSGVLSVTVRSERELAAGWNDLLPSDPPIWFDPEQLAGPALAGLDWTEDQVWREYPPAAPALGHAVKQIAPISGPDGLIGLRLLLDGGGRLELRDTGDEIAAFYLPPQARADCSKEAQP